MSITTRLLCLESHGFTERQLSVIGERGVSDGLCMCPTPITFTVELLINVLFLSQALVAVPAPNVSAFSIKCAMALVGFGLGCKKSMNGSGSPSHTEESAGLSINITDGSSMCSLIS